MLEIKLACFSGGTCAFIFLRNHLALPGSFTGADTYFSPLTGCKLKSQYEYQVYKHYHPTDLMPYMQSIEFGTNVQKSTSRSYACYSH